MKEPHERLKYLIDTNFANASEFARKLDFPPSGMGNYLNGKSKLGGKFAPKFQELGLDYNWYLTGIESPKNEDVSAEYKFMEEVEMDDFPTYANTGTIIDVNQLETSTTNLFSFFKVPKKSNYRALRILGDSMVGEGIKDGDVILYEPTDNVPSGKMAIVSLNGMLLVKRLHIVNNRFILRSANISVADITQQIDDNLKTIGLVIFIVNPVNS